MESLIFKIIRFTGSSFSFLREDFRKEFQEQNPDIKSMYDIGKACGEKWKTMTYENASSCTRFARTQSESNRRNCLLSATRYVLKDSISFDFVSGNARNRSSTNGTITQEN
ncbi:hypothetical protein AAZV13_08G076100 [Glycine max]